MGNEVDSYSLNEIKHDILRAYASSTYQKINAYYCNDNIFSIIGKSRSENVHSNFLYWLFNCNSNHGLGVYPIQMLLRVIDYVKTKSINQGVHISNYYDCFIDNINKIRDVGIYKEKTLRSEEKNNRRIDLLFIINYIDELKLPQLRIVVENKVNSLEHNNQTSDYYNRIQAARDKNVEHIFLYLSPESDCLNRRQCESDKFIQLNYQLLLDYVIQPCKSRCTSTEANFYLENYIRCLGDTSIFEEGNTKGVVVMAVSKDENKLLRTFWDDNEKLIKATINSVLNDEEHNFTSDEREYLSKALQIDVKSRKKKYSFKGEKLPLNRIVLKFIEFYVSNNSNATYKDLCKIFPKEIQGSFGIIKKKNDLNESDKGNNRTNKHPYFFINEPITLKNGCEIVVCNQWGAGGSDTNFEKFIDIVNKLNYSSLIEEIK